jgi:hypothetical protein
MKKSELPQDKSALVNFTRELCYVKNDEGKYEAELSTGWEAKTVALDKAWEEIDSRIHDAVEKVRNGEASPILYFMELRLMDFLVLSGYTGFWQWQIKRHIKPEIFVRLSERKLKKYATAFDVTVEELKNYKPL